MSNMAQILETDNTRGPLKWPSDTVLHSRPSSIGSQKNVEHHKSVRRLNQHKAVPSIHSNSSNVSISKLRKSDPNIVIYHLDEPEVFENQKEKKKIVTNDVKEKGSSRALIIRIASDHNDNTFLIANQPRRSICTSSFSTDFKELNTNYLLNHGMVITKYGVEEAFLPAFDFNPDHSGKLTNILYIGKQSVEFNGFSTPRDSFMSAQGIELNNESASPEKLKPFLDFEPNPSFNPLFDQSPAGYVHCSALCQQVLIEVEPSDIIPSDGLKSDITSALLDDNPFEQLTEVFQKYGHWWCKTVILGNKLERKCEVDFLNIDSYSNERARSIEWLLRESEEMTIYDELVKCDPLFLTWEDTIRPLNASYLVSSGGDVIDREHLERWFTNIPKRPWQWCIIKRVLAPIYEILDDTIRQELDNLLVKYPKVLMTGCTRLKSPNVIYRRMKFKKPLKTDNYQVFGSLVDSSGFRVPDTYVKFECRNEYGFSATIHTTGKKRKENPTLNINEKYYIIWFLTGIPQELGYFHPDNRFIFIRLGTLKLRLGPDIEWIARFDSGITLFPGFVLSASFHFPPTNQEFNLTANIESWSPSGLIALEIENHTIDDFGKVPNIECELRWCIIAVDSTKVISINMRNSGGNPQPVFWWGSTGRRLGDHLPRAN
ncbi:hypothetical protein G9A89_019144 [Geosiphon pyriformis]|nr:hypothetical protein G9A89_019144 [Geosiphon pyriformis]